MSFPQVIFINVCYNLSMLNNGKSFICDHCDYVYPKSYSVIVKPPIKKGYPRRICLLCSEIKEVRKKYGLKS